MTDSVVPQSAQQMTDEDEVLRYTLGVRKNIVSKITANGNIPTDDPKQMATLLAALDGMDRSALGQKRIKSEENIAGANQAMAATVISQLLNQASGAGMKPFHVVDAVPREAPKLGSDIPEPTLVEGETSVNPGQMSYDSFIKKFTPEDGLS